MVTRVSFSAENQKVNDFNEFRPTVVKDGKKDVITFGYEKDNKVKKVKFKTSEPQVSELFLQILQNTQTANNITPENEKYMRAVLFDTFDIMTNSDINADALKAEYEALVKKYQDIKSEGGADITPKEYGDIMKSWYDKFVK